MTKRLAALAFITVAAAMTTACSSNMDELELYIDQVKSKPGGVIEPLPTPKADPRYTYEPGNRRPPFTPDAPINVAAATTGQQVGPDPDRAQEYLEQFPLDTFRMVGNLEIRGTMIGLVENAEGYVYQVRVGNFLGQNYGEIVSITPSDIELMEWHPDGQGGYLQRPTRISLSE